MVRRTPIVKWQGLEDISSNFTYTDWVKGRVNREGELKEPVKANPDSLPYKEPLEKTDELLAILRVLDERGECVLTKKQKKAFQLVVRQGKTLEQAARQMKCSFQAVDCFVKAAAVKLRKLCLKYM